MIKAPKNSKVVMLSGNLDMSKRTCKVVALSEKIHILYEEKKLCQHISHRKSIFT